MRLRNESKRDGEGEITKPDSHRPSIVQIAWPPRAFAAQKHRTGMLTTDTVGFGLIVACLARVGSLLGAWLRRIIPQRPLMYGPFS